MSMWTAILISLCVGVVGVIIAFSTEDDIIGGFGVLIMIGSLVAVVYFIFSGIARDWRQNKAELDRWSRTFIVSDVVIESRQLQDEEKGCVQSLVLNRTPYTFEVSCSVFMKPYFLQPPKIGDTLQIKFLAPKQRDGKPEVWEVYSVPPKVEAELRSFPTTPEAPAN